MIIISNLKVVTKLLIDSKIYKMKNSNIYPVKTLCIFMVSLCPAYVQLMSSLCPAYVRIGQKLDVN